MTKTVALSEVATINPRIPKQLSEQMEVSFLPMAAVSENGSVVKEEIRIVGEVKKGYTYFERNDILIAKITPCFENGKAALVSGLKHAIGFGSTEFHVVRPDPESLDGRYAFYLLWNPAFRRAGEQNMTGSAGQKRVPADFLARTKIPLPPLIEQKRIAAILDKADSLRRKRQQAIQLADRFLRAVFLDMFGDPIANPKGFKLRALRDLYINPEQGTKCGPFGSALKKEEFVPEGVPVWNMDNISLSGTFTDVPALWVSDAKYNELTAYSVIDGDVIISRAGTVGKMGVVRTKYEKSLISTNLIRVRFSEELSPEYFVSLMTYCKGRVGRLKTGPDGSFTHMNTGVLDSIEFPWPPVQFQKKYLAIREKVLRTSNRMLSAESLNADNLESISRSVFVGKS